MCLSRGGPPRADRVNRCRPDPQEASVVPEFWKCVDSKRCNSSVRFLAPLWRLRDKLALASSVKVSRAHDSVPSLLFNSLNNRCFICRHTATGCAQMQHLAQTECQSPQL